MIHILFVIYLIGLGVTFTLSLEDDEDLIVALGIAIFWPIGLIGAIVKSMKDDLD